MTKENSKCVINEKKCILCQAKIISTVMAINPVPDQYLSNTEFMKGYINDIIYQFKHLNSYKVKALVYVCM